MIKMVDRKIPAVVKEERCGDSVTNRREREKSVADCCDTNLSDMRICEISSLQVFS